MKLQCLRLVCTIAIFTLFQNISHQLLFCLWLVVTIIVSPPYFSVSFTFSQIKSQCLRPLLQNERDKSTSSEAKEAPGEFCNNSERVDDNDNCWKWKWIKKAKTGRSHKNDTVYLFAKNQRSENAYMRKGLLNWLRVGCLWKAGKVYGKFMPALHFHLTTKAVWKHAQL